jgi:hypothetical protein
MTYILRITAIQSNLFMDTNKDAFHVIKMPTMTYISLTPPGLEWFKLK